MTGAVLFYLGWLAGGVTLLGILFGAFLIRRRPPQEPCIYCGRHK